VLYKTKLFSSQFLVVKNGETLLWETALTSDDLDQQINDWVETTENVIVSCSSPAIHGEWLDDTKQRKTIIITVMVIYSPRVTDNDGQSYPEFKP
jgi:hypothetical protein